MPCTDPTAATDRREFRARFPSRLWAVGWAAVALSRGVWIAMWTIAHALDPSGETAGPWRFALEISVVPLFVLVLTGFSLLEARRASVLLDADGLVVTDWRRKQQRILWDDVLWLRTARWAGRSGGVMRVGTAAGSVRFAYPIDQPEALRQEIVARAGLAELQKGWFRLTYRRAHTSPSPPYPRPRKAAG